MIVWLYILFIDLTSLFFLQPSAENQGTNELLDKNSSDVINTFENPQYEDETHGHRSLDSNNLSNTSFVNTFSNDNGQDVNHPYFTPVYYVNYECVPSLPYYPVEGKNLRSYYTQCC